MNSSLLLAIISLAVNIFTIIFIFGYWKGKVDVRLTTLWEVYVTSVLTREQQRLRGHSRAVPPFPSTWEEKTKELCFTWPLGELGYQVVKRIGAKEIQRVALENGASFGETLARFLLEKGACAK